jgi:hypothetical protein
MIKAIAKVVIIWCIGFGMAVALLTYLDSRNVEWPAETWQPVQEDTYFVISPPGTMLIFEIEERDGELHWRRSLMPIPKEWLQQSKNGPTTEEELEKEENRKFRERWKFDHPKFAPDDHVIETTKNKKKKKKKDVPLFDVVDKDGVLQDSNEDGILEFSTALFLHRQENGAEILHTTYRHICCLCGLEHRVSIRVYVGFGTFRLYQRWDVDDKATHFNRLRKFGPDYYSIPEFNSMPKFDAVSPRFPDIP